MSLRAPRRNDFVHQALLYDNVDAFVAAVVPFLRDGVRHGDATILVAPPANLAAVETALPAAEAGSVLLEPAGERYARAAHAFSSWQQLFSEHVHAGRRVRAVGEQPVAALPAEDVVELCLMDAALNDVGRQCGVSVVCPYNVAVVPPSVVGAVLRSHPEVSVDGVRRPSARYTDPTALLTEERHGPPLPRPPHRVAELPAPRRPGEVRAFVAEQARRAGLATPELDDFLVAVGEITANAFSHARIDRVRVWRAGGRLVCEVRDRGPGLADLLVGYRQPDTDPVGGRGLWLARELTDLVQIRTGPRGTTVRLLTALER